MLPSCFEVAETADIAERRSQDVLVHHPDLRVILTRAVLLIKLYRLFYLMSELRWRRLVVRSQSLSLALDHTQEAVCSLWIKLCIVY